MRHLLARALVMVAANALATSPAVLAAGTPPPTLPIQDPVAPAFMTVGGATPLATDVTVPYWHGQFTDPTNGVTYGYNMVGNEDPRVPGAGRLRRRAQPRHAHRRRGALASPMVI